MNRSMLPRKTARAVVGQDESLGMTITKALVVSAAVAVYMLPLATSAGIVASVMGSAAAYFSATWLHARGLRLGVGITGALALIATALWMGGWVRGSTGFWGFLSVPATISTADVVSLGLVWFALLGALRLIAMRIRAASFIEVLLVAGAAITLLSGHRERTISEPRWFADWALSNGWDPTTLLTGLGLAVTGLGLIMLLRKAHLGKILLSYLLMLLVGAAVYYLFEDHVIEQDVSSNGLGLTQQEQQRQAEKEEDSKPPESGGGSGRGPSSDDPFKDNYDGGEPSPVALVVMRDDYDTTDQGSVLYFRQRVLSRFAEGRLQPATDLADTDADRDVIGRFPRDAAVKAPPVQVREHHVEFPTTMHLMVDHPQPVALTHAEQLRPADNPNPRHFVASYHVDSLRLALGHDRLVGRSSIGEDWDEKARQHYLTLPDDPRYGALADIVLRDLDPRFIDDDVMKALVIKRHLEKEGFYTLRETHKDAADPTASFLFGSLRGYCVHFAHAAAFLLRSQGIAARVALGYAVQTHKRSGGSSILIMSNDAHAWPEIHIAGVGWVTFDIYPERSDEPPRPPVDRNLESMLGEIARDDPTGGKNPDPDGGFAFPWRALGWFLLGVFGLLLIGAYSVKWTRIAAPSVGDGARAGLTSFRALLDRLADVGIRRQHGETREHFAQRLAGLMPSLPELTHAHLRMTLGRANTRSDHAHVSALARTAVREYRRNTSWWVRSLGALNPIGWWFTR